MRKIFDIFKYICTFVGAAVILLGILFGWVYNSDSAVEIKPHSMLLIDFADNYAEVKSDALLDDIVGGETMTLQDLITAIGIAAADPRIDGIVALIDNTTLEFAQVQDVARAIAGFRKSGKKTYVFSQGFGSLGQGNREYYLASFFDDIYMQPHTLIGLTGIDIEIPFAREVLDRIGINPEFYQRYEYKTAMMSFTDKEISDEYRGEMQRLSDALLNELKQGITANRELHENIDDIINNAPYSAEKGLELGLVDAIMYLPELEKKLRDEGHSGYVNISDYATQIKPNEGDLPTIAILYLNGIIDTGESTSDFNGEYTVGSKTILAELAEIDRLKNLKALIVRIDSPGGSYNAADEIYFAIKDFKNVKQIPVIVSQGGYAASGGYFISLAGDKIIAEPTTITGSIGVLGGKFDFAGLWQKLGISWAQIKSGENADILSSNRPFSAKEKELFNESLDEIYRDFTAKVTENRPIKQNIDTIARGRVWSGREAMKLGLVDEIGGLNEAVAAAKAASSIAPDVNFRLISYPREKTFGEKIYELLSGGGASFGQVIIPDGVNINDLKLFKRMQYDTVLIPFKVNM